MADRVTCCPHCSTSFRITDTQLQSAKGAVRCGSCLKVFKALDHLLPDPKAAPIESTEQPKPTTHEEAESPSADITEAQDDTDDQAENTDSSRLDFDQSGIDQPFDADDMLISDDFQSDHGGAGLFDRDIKISEPVPQDDSDESWAVGLLEEEEEEESTPDNSSEWEQPEPSPDNSDFDYNRKTTGSFSALDDSDIEAALGESFQSSERKEPTFSLVEDEQQLDELVELDADVDTHPDDAQDNVAMLLQSIQAAPVEMEWQAYSEWPRRLLWGSLSLLAALALMAQIGVYKFNDLSRIEPYRSVYASSCPLLGCQLPSLADPARVKAYNLVIRSHPRTDNALVVDSILLNSAPFTQPFPDLLLNFSDIKGRPIASRRFTAAEYLSGEMAGITEMPSGQPVHISLDIIDPGPEAVNYSAEVPLN
jgi:predicted Zn finger-like uncharacterized protein